MQTRALRLWYVILLVAAFLEAATVCAEPVEPPHSSLGTLIVAVVNDPPMTMKNEQNQWTGFCVELWKEIAASLGLEYEFREMRYREIEDAVRAGEVDLSVSPFHQTVDRYRVFDFSTVFGTSKLAVAILPEKDVHPYWAAVKMLFSWRIMKVALLLLAVIFAAGLILWLMERKHNPDYAGHPAYGIGTGIYWVGSTLVSGVCTGVGLKTTQGRLIGLVWILIGAVAFGALTASLTSSLIENQQFLSYSFDESALRRMHMGCVAGTAEASLLGKMGGAYSLFESTEDGLRALLAKHIDGFLGSERLIGFEERRFARKFSMHPTDLKRMRFGFAFPQGSPLRELINTPLMSIMEGPEWEKLAGRYGLTPNLEPAQGKGGR